MNIKSIIKQILRLSPIALTKNHGYDIQTKRIFKKVLSSSSNCIDVGCHKGEILDLILSISPQGKHFGFEPIPDLYDALVAKYKTRSNCKISSIAASNKKGESSFNYVVSNPSYSGLIKRSYDKKNEKDKSITVQIEKLDNVIPSNLKIDLIKIDVEGGELLVLEGAKNLLKAQKPIIIFEHGLGASDHYDSGPGHIFEYFTDLSYSIYTLDDFLNGGSPLDKKTLKDQFYKQENYYFIAEVRK